MGAGSAEEVGTGRDDAQVGIGRRPLDEQFMRVRRGTDRACHFVTDSVHISVYIGAL